MTAPLQTTFAEVEAIEIPEILPRRGFPRRNRGNGSAGTQGRPPVRGALSRLAASDAFAKLKSGGGQTLSFPAGLQAEAVLALKYPRKPTAADARAAGATIAGFNAATPLSILAGSTPRIAEIALGLGLKAYDFSLYRTPVGTR